MPTGGSTFAPSYWTLSAPNWNCAWGTRRRRLSKREAAKALPVDRPGRGLTREGELFQVALPSWSPVPGPDGEVVAIAEAVAEAKAGRCAIRAPRVAALPESLREPDVGAFSGEAGSAPADRAGGFLLGVSEFRCRPCPGGPSGSWSSPGGLR